MSEAAAMIDGDWTMADGFTPTGRHTYCRKPKACSAPASGFCPICQNMQRRNLLRSRIIRGQVPRMTGESLPTFLDADFDDMEAWS